MNSGSRRPSERQLAWGVRDSVYPCIVHDRERHRLEQEKHLTPPDEQFNLHYWPRFARFNSISHGTRNYDEAICNTAICHSPSTPLELHWRVFQEAHMQVRPEVRLPWLCKSRHPQLEIQYQECKMCVKVCSILRKNTHCKCEVSSGGADTWLWQVETTSKP